MSRGYIDVSCKLTLVRILTECSSLCIVENVILISNLSFPVTRAWYRNSYLLEIIRGRIVNCYYKLSCLRKSFFTEVALSISWIRGRAPFPGIIIDRRNSLIPHEDLDSMLIRFSTCYKTVLDFLNIVLNDFFRTCACHSLMVLHFSQNSL
jgi:hypothetical protein